jgi:transcriptional regulator with XRE-family HTH domain
MTLSDLLTYLRARKGGVYYSDVSEAVGIPALHLVRAERTFTVPSLTPDELGRLAEYFGVPVDDLRRAQRTSRSDLTAYLAAREKASAPVYLQLLGDVRVSGRVAWRDRHAIALRQPDGSSVVVYRSSVDSWGEESEV